MKNLRKSMSVVLILLVSLFCLSTVAFASTSEQDGLKVELTTDKENYSLNEDIKINVTVTNTNDVTVENVKIDTLLPEEFILKDKNKSTSSEAVDIPAGKKIEFSVVAVVKDGKSDKTSSDTDSKLTGTSTNNKVNINKQNDKSPYTGKDYAVMTGFSALFIIGIVLLILCLKRNRKKTSKAVSSALCLVLAVTSIIGLADFKAKAENKQSDTDTSSVISISENIPVDGKDYTIETNVSYFISDNNIHLTIDNSENTVTDFNQVLSGTFSLSSNVHSVTYTIATEIDNYEITNKGKANINGNTYSADIQLKPETNKITVTATTENGKTESKTVKIIYDSGKIYELDENHIAYDSKTNTYYVDNIILIFFDEGVSDNRRNEIVSSINGKVVGSMNGVNQWQVEINPTNLKGLKEICANLEKEDGVSAAFVDTTSKASIDISTNDPYKNAEGGNWYLDAIDAYSAWDYNERFNYIDIGVVDNGFDVGHEDLKGVINFPNESLKQNNKKAEHGTHVAGIIGANANNKKGMAGLVWKSKLWCVDWQPEGRQEWNTQNEILSGLTYTVEAGAKIVNYSIGGTGFLPNGYTEYSTNIINEWGSLSSVYMYQLLNKNKDFVVIQSAGNGTSGKDDPYDDKEKADPEKKLAVDAINNGYFCSITEENAFSDENITKQDILDRIIIVGNAKKNNDGNYQQAVDSNGGSRVDICAPGTNIYSTVPGEIYDGWGGWINGSYSNLSGTSMAAPMVTAVCGMVWSVNSKFTGAEVKDIVCNSYDKNIWVWDNPDGKHTTNDKYRMLNAKLSVEEAIRRTDNKGSISGRVKEQETNLPISNLEVRIYNENYTPGNEMYTQVDKTKTDSDGNFNFSLPSGEYILQVGGESDIVNDYGYWQLECPITIVAGVPTVLLNDILLNRIENGITGYVYDNDDFINNAKDTPISDVLIEVYKDNNLIGKTTTDKNGKYSISVDKNGSYDLLFKKSGYNDEKKPFTDVNGGFANVNAHLQSKKTIVNGTPITKMKTIDYGQYTGNLGDSCMFNLDRKGLPGRDNRYYGNGNIGIDGTVYENGLEGWVARWNFKPEISWAYITYDIGGLYKQFSGNTNLIKSYSSSFNTTLYIYGDDKLLYSQVLTNERYDYSFNINVSNIRNLKIMLKDNVAVKSGTSFAIYDMFLN